MNRWKVTRAGMLAMLLGGGVAVTTTGCAQAGDGARGSGFGHGGHHGFGRHRGAEAFCAGEAGEHLQDMTAYVADRLELRPDQRTLLEDVERSTAVVAEDMRSLCARPDGSDPVAMLDYGEQALEQSLQGLRSVRPSLERFLASLDEPQREEVQAFLSHRRRRG